MTEALFIDFETCDEVNIEKHGSTEPTLMYYAFWDGPMEIWETGDELPEKVLEHVVNGGKVYSYFPDQELLRLLHNPLVQAARAAKQRRRS